MNSYFDSTTAPAMAPRHSQERYAHDPDRIDLIITPDCIRAGERLHIRAKVHARDPYDNVRAVIATADGTSRTIVLVEDLAHPTEYIGSVDTAGWPGGRCCIEGQLLYQGSLTLAFRTFAVVTPYNTVPSRRWNSLY
jgi:hypothetical protein